MKFILTILLVMVLFPGRPAMAIETAQTVRVAILKGARSIKIEGSGLSFTNGIGLSIAISSPATVTRSGRGITVGRVQLGSLRISASDFIRINGKGYRGTIEVLPDGKGLLVINEILLEEYLVGLINCEISSQWPIEAVKAQAVVARSYALFQKEARKNLPYHLESTVYDQVYSGCDIEDSRAARAVEETRGEVLLYEGKVVQAFFHSSCGGHTEASENVWSVKLPYLQGVECSYCLENPSVRWEQSLTNKKVESVLRASGYQVSGLQSIRPRSRYPSGRINELEITSALGTITMPAVTFRKLIGYTVIKSTAFSVTQDGTTLVFTGTGYGHGVGLCQWGAKQRAEEGFNYLEILSYYYPGTTVANWYLE